MRTTRRASVLLMFFAAVALAAAEPYAVGDRIEPFALEDQHGSTRAIDDRVEVILFSRDMDGGDVLEAALSEVAPEVLSSRNAVYVSDISGMPGLIAKMFAIPSMRRRAYPMALDRDGIATARLPDVAEKATLVFLERLEITRVLHLGSPAEVREALGLAKEGASSKD